MDNGREVNKSTLKLYGDHLEERRKAKVELIIKVNKWFLI